MKTVYISQSYDEENHSESMEKAKLYFDYVFRCGFVPINPLVMFDKAAHVDLQEVKASLINNSNMMWCMGDFSEAMQSDIDVAQNIGQPIMSVTDEMVTDEWYICQYDKQLTADDVIPSSKQSDYESQLLVVNPDVIKSELCDSFHSLYYATSGFGCSPTARGSAVYVENISTGEKMRFERHDFLGIVKPESFTKWFSDHPVRSDITDKILLEMSEQSTEITAEQGEER